MRNFLTVEKIDVMLPEFYNFGVRAKSKPELWIPFDKLIPDHHLTLTGYGRHNEDFGTPNFFMSYVETEVEAV